MKHFFELLDFKKAFKDAQAYHQYAIKNGDAATKQFHLNAHVKAITHGNIPIHNDKSISKNTNKVGGI